MKNKVEIKEDLLVKWGPGLILGNITVGISKTCGQIEQYWFQINIKSIDTAVIFVIIINVSAVLWQDLNQWYWYCMNTEEFLSKLSDYLPSCNLIFYSCDYIFSSLQILLCSGASWCTILFDIPWDIKPSFGEIISLIRVLIKLCFWCLYPCI